MHIKDYATAQGWFRKHAAAPSSVGSWKAFVARNKRAQEPRTMAQEPRNMYSQGQLVQNAADGSRPGYQGPDKYITPAKRSGAAGFPGQKFYVVKNESYSDGRQKVKTKEYAAWLEKEKAKAKLRPDYALSLIHI